MHRQRGNGEVPAVRRTLVAMALLFGVAACDDSPPGAINEVSGIVRGQAESGAPQPIEGATVVFRSDTGLETEAVTDGSGRYAMDVFTDVSFGQVRAEASGWTAAESTVYFDLPRRRIDLVLRAAVD